MMGERGGGVAERDVEKGGFAALLGGPHQQRHVHQRVDKDVAAPVFLAEEAPAGNVAGHAVVLRRERAGGGQRRAVIAHVPGELPGLDRARHEHEAQVVIAGVGRTRQQPVGKIQRAFAARRVALALVREPQQPGPEPPGPDPVRGQLPLPVFGDMGEIRHRPGDGANPVDGAGNRRVVPIFCCHSLPRVQGVKTPAAARAARLRPLPPDHRRVRREPAARRGTAAFPPLQVSSAPLSRHRIPYQRKRFLSFARL